MSRPSACPIVLSASARDRLEHLTLTATAQHRQVLRASIVLLAAQGMSNSGIAELVGVCVDTARTWRNRYAAHGPEGSTGPGPPPSAPAHRRATGAGQSPGM